VAPAEAVPPDPADKAVQAEIVVVIVVATADPVAIAAETEVETGAQAETAGPTAP